MKSFWCIASILVIWSGVARSADFEPAPQHYRQEIALKFAEKDGIPAQPVQLLDMDPAGVPMTFISGKWFELVHGRWEPSKALNSDSRERFIMVGPAGNPVEVPIAPVEILQILRVAPALFIATSNACFSISEKGQLVSLGWPSARRLHQMALSPERVLYVASESGLFFLEDRKEWRALEVRDDGGRAWARWDVLGITFDTKGQLWFGTKAGVGCRTPAGWRFFEGKDGLPWNDFTSLAAGPHGEVWFGTHLGVVCYDGSEWCYRQGPRWLPSDDVRAATVDRNGTVWFATAGGLGCIQRTAMTLAEKADWYEGEIQKFIKRTPFGYVAEAQLRKAADKASANPQDSDNDGLWTSMYGAGECFAYAATKDTNAKERAKQAFEALRFLQKVTQGGEHEPPKGYIARTIRPSDWPDPNLGRLAGDLEAQKTDKFWKAYEPRWPKSRDGKWYWKSDTSSDELDGHYFFYPLYYDLCADSEPERERVREVVREITDHLISHGFTLVDHDGKPTRWGVYAPEFLNREPLWWQERGLKSLSMLCYLSVAAHVTGDAKYRSAARELMDLHGYAHNAMYAKVQQGPGSGNQSDDEMAFMCYYGLLRCSDDETLKSMMRYSFFRYWVNEAPEMNPFFNFAYAAHCLNARGVTPWGEFPLKPWSGWHSDSMATLYGFPLDRLNWPLHNSQRLDIVDLPSVRSSDIESPDRRHERGHRVNGKVLPVENRHFNHWNTDPWQLDYGGDGGELAAGTVFLLPYYMGLYHGFIEKPLR